MSNMRTGLTREELEQKIAPMFPEYRFCVADVSDEEAVMGMYRSMIGTDGCTWNMDYPNEENFRLDVADERLFCLKDARGSLIAVISIDHDALVDALPVWMQLNTLSGELARLAVREDYQNRGIARRMILATMEVLRLRGYASARFLVSKTHTRALKSYAKLAFTFMGESDLYGHEWYCYEKRLEE